MPRGRGKVEISLFPFLSVLCCMIGVFMLFLVAIISTRAIDAEEAAQQPPPPATHGRAKHADPDAIDEASYRALEQRLEELTGQLASRRAERDELERRLETLRAALDAKRDELEFAAGQLVSGRRPIELDKPALVRPVPDPNFKVDKKPIYIEVDAEGYLVQPDKVRYPSLDKKRIGKDEKYVASRDLRRFLDKVNDNHQTQYLLILVHPSGAEGYQALRNYLSRTYQGRIDVGTEPFSYDWQFIAEQSQP